MDYNGNRIKRNPDCTLSTNLSNINELKDNGYNISGNPTIVNTPFGKAMNFDGNGDYVTLDRFNSTFEGVSKYSILFWINPGWIGSDQIIIHKGEATAGSFIGINAYTNGSMYLQPDFTNNYRAKIKDVPYINVGSWSHVAMVYDGTQAGNSNRFKAYFDGVQKTLDYEGTIPASTLTGFTQRFIVGCYPTATPSNFLNGKIEGLAFFKRALTAQEIEDIYKGDFNYDKNLISWWDMSEINPQDKKGTNNGTGTSITSADIVQGYKGKAINFDGANDYVNGGAGASLDFERTSAFSLSAIFKTSTILYGSIITKAANVEPYRGYHTYFGEGVDAGRIFFLLTNDNAGGNLISVKTNSTYNDNKFYHLVITYDGTSATAGMKIYIDGVAVATTSNTDNLSATISNANNLNIGARNAGLLFNGIIDNVKIYNKSLTALEVMDLYQRER